MVGHGTHFYVDCATHFVSKNSYSTLCTVFTVKSLTQKNSSARIFGAQWSMRHVGLMYSWSQCDKYLPRINGRRTGMCREAKNQTFNFDYYFGNVNNGIWQNNTYQKKACCLIYLLRNLQVKRTDFGHFYFIPKKMCRHKRKKWYKKKKRLLTCTVSWFHAIYR